MGQYFRAVMGDTLGDNRRVFDRTMINKGRKLYLGAKLMEMAWIGEGYSDTIAHQLIGSPHRMLWVGDYGEELSVFNGPYETIGDKVLENSGGANMPTYEEVWGDNRHLTTLTMTPAMDWEKYYLVNHERKEYIPMNKYLNLAVYKLGKWTVCIDPLPLLTAVVTEESDYRGKYKEYVGTWAWNIISVEEKRPVGYKEIMPLFKESFE